jgi:glyoxalase family protein
MFELVATDRDHRASWVAEGFDADTAVRGLHGVTLTVRDAAGTIDLMTRLLSYRIVGEADHRTRLAAGAEAPGHFIDVVADPNAAQGINGLGTVHHVAMAIASEGEQLRLRAELLQYGCKVTEVRDRCYFKSIYFREPGGVLFEVATIQPGFTADEELANLGRDLKLPPWEEPNRREIEAALVAVEY